MTYFLLLTLTLLSLTGCEPFAIASTALVGATIAEERSAGDKVDDNIIKLKIKDKFAQTEISELLSRISVNVMEGRVMLTGSLSTFEHSKTAIDLAWKTRGVKEVINEVVISNKDPHDRPKDLWITSSVNSKLLIEKNLHSLNYIVDVNEQIVYLLGIAQNENELKRAMKIASEIKGVKSVVNHVILKNDPRRIGSY